MSTQNNHPKNHNDNNNNQPPSRKCSSNPACAACSFHNTRCPPGCILAPYFPQAQDDIQIQVQNVHALFGFHNIRKMLTNIDDETRRDDAMTSLMYEADARGRDPIGGCHRIVCALQGQYTGARRELEFVTQLNALCKGMYGSAEQKQDIVNDQFKACRHLRRKCGPDCIFAPYFPLSQKEQFQNAHKLFGVSFIKRAMERINGREHRDDAMASIKYEADARARDPVGGCCRIVLELDQQLREAEDELKFVKQLLAFYKPVVDVTMLFEDFVFKFEFKEPNEQSSHVVLIFECDKVLCKFSAPDAGVLVNGSEFVAAVFWQCSAGVVGLFWLFLLL
ncbi:hypothetical protein CTI12_AA263120 [Artemisia annua]|uniref:LOB domain-containing protein n=1 Tax=Artemisia annua TaxID=35608 RepID=A0A2U1NI02_ARTAN|nr:hypothetical protein CTI12_AA263120 [Artemisia annua]